ncbi:MAG TPA: hypothetical protein VFI25_01415 [Planctomycetota bacterium]|nr:hypothetical protein [Planctomycetota bacterium]
MDGSSKRTGIRAGLGSAALPLALLSLSLASGLSAGCASPGATAGATAVGDPARLYARGCALCHPLHRPGTFPGAVWTERVRRFGARGGLTRAECGAVLRYLLENASDAPSRGSAAPGP